MTQTDMELSQRRMDTYAESPSPALTPRPPGHSACRVLTQGVRLQAQPGSERLSWDQAGSRGPREERELQRGDGQVTQKISSDQQVKQGDCESRAFTCGAPVLFGFSVCVTAAVKRRSSSIVCSFCFILCLPLRFLFLPPDLHPLGDHLCREETNASQRSVFNLFYFILNRYLFPCQRRTYISLYCM